MRKLIAALVVGGGLFSGLGCMGNAEYVQKNKDGGIIALKVNADEAEARKLMEKHLGSQYEIVETYDPKTRAGAKPDAKSGMLTPKEDGVMHIAYRKLPDSQFGGTTPLGLPPVPINGGSLPAKRTAQPASTGGAQTAFGSEPEMKPPAMYPGQ